MEPPAPPDGTKDGEDGKGGVGAYLSSLISVLLSPLTGRRRPKQVCVLCGGVLLCAYGTEAERRQ